ncbi:ECF-type sigma factor [Vibrio sp. 10N.261.46.E12]|uniref:ECF-type sigma factor n=1 Tax=unclassified Vibrio TaxID=2614977 RepID=UPI000978083D|nr:MULTISPECIES: ECF-type sigma factor [unclassified Vibrio]OMO35620.1 RNA polymerase subunit sigma [Vibrio sp. 10N.261.45.E1]PMJ37108.1 RNA polymerase subunit sigma [Vibrio sp. 10N.286.45.B6]PML84773.1 RNA polymerase subunit sigma [Vibrio sp. 10N.261.49.E11]PMM72774.1 RNA polymerase subunit sigma [Vibrio sp. 10N.261.46.F12]PMM82615.1 RNA polymerase subunit sigma [Vibrio sp. 10N.261.46.E8]
MGNHLTDIESVMNDWKAGHKGAEEKLYQFAYAHLYTLAQEERKRSITRHEQSCWMSWNSINNTTALVHDAYLKLSSSDTQSIKDTRDFMLMAAKIMRQILIDNARRQQAKKRQHPAKVPPQEERHFEQLIIIDKVVDHFTLSYPRQSKAFKLKYLMGLQTQEISQLLACSDSLIEKDLKFSRCWLMRKINTHHNPIY